MKNNKIIPSVDTERKLFVKDIICTCSNPCLYDVESESFYKKTKWQHRRKKEYSEYSDLEKRNTLNDKADFLTHCFNIFFSYIENPQNDYFSSMYNILTGKDEKQDPDNLPDISEWKEFPEILSFLEPLLPENMKLGSVIFAGAEYFNEDYSGFCDKIDGLTIDDYRSYFKNSILPAYIWLWKEVLSLDQDGKDSQNEMSAPDNALSTIFKDWTKLKMELLQKGTLSEISGGRGYVFNDDNHSNFLMMLRENRKTMTLKESSRARTIIENNIFPGNETNRFVKKTICNNF